jgi:PAS domain S-box-containing protein
MVVFQQLSGTELGDRRRLALLRDRAVIATEMSFTITDPRLPDDPLVWVNPSFTRLTGYRLDEVVGRNCRLLQGPNTDPSAIRRIGDALRRCAPITEVLLNYRRDGTAYRNQVSISPATDGSGEVVDFVGVQNDVTERVMVEQERRSALAEAEESRAQLRLLAEATTQMTGALDVTDACARLARIAVPALADLSAVDLVNQPGRGPSRRVAVAARDAGDEALLRELGAVRAYAPGTANDTGRVLDGCGPVLIPELSERGAERYPDDPAAAAVFERLRLRSAMVVPVRARGCVLGALTLLTQHPYGRRYGPRDVHLAADLAGRAGLAVDNARLYEVEHAAALTLQRTLLPVVPEVEGLQIATRHWSGWTATRSAATGTTCCRCPTARSASPSATSPGTTCAPRRRWGSCAASCAPTPGTATSPGRCSTAATSSYRGWRWPRWPRRLRTARPAGSRRHPHPALRQRRAPDAAADVAGYDADAHRAPGAHGCGGAARLGRRDRRRRRPRRLSARSVA